jgi:hypothetical protein
MVKKNIKKTRRTYKKKRISKSGCYKQKTKKYSNRPSPPYRANMCPGLKKKGNDGNMYISKSYNNFTPSKWVKL